MRLSFGRHQNGTQHSDNQHYENQYNDTHHADSQSKQHILLCRSAQNFCLKQILYICKPFILRVVILAAAMLNVVILIVDLLSVMTPF